MKWAYRALLVLFIGILASMLYAGQHVDNTALITEKEDPSTLILAVANTPALRAKGLSGYDRLEPNHGLLFVFDDLGIKCMWARDMKFDITVMFLDLDGKVVNQERMYAGSDIPHCSSQPVMYAIETN